MTRPNAVLARLRRAYWHLCGEQCLTTTFWPGDYWLHSEIEENGQRYHITRYTRATDRRLYEVWARPLDRPAKQPPEGSWPPISLQSAHKR